MSVVEGNNFSYGFTSAGVLFIHTEKKKISRASSI
jgi:hypothetical protein